MATRQSEHHASVRVAVRPELLRWAVDRAQLPDEDLAKVAPKFDEWLAGTLTPTLKQLERFADRTYTPFGFLLLAAPPAEPLPIADFRTFIGTVPRRPSPNLLDTIYACQRRQEWYRTHALQEGYERLNFVGTMNTAVDIVAGAATIRAALAFEVEQRLQYSSWTDAFRGLVENAEALGALVMVNGVVGANTHRTLDPREFRGFALVDDLAPVVFVNGADTKAAQIFTLAHEIAHLWLGVEGVTNSTLAAIGNDDTEAWCNRVAAEILVPISSLDDVTIGADLAATFNGLARKYRVSTLVILRRLRDAGQLTASAFRTAYEDELKQILDHKKAQGGGGDFYNTQPVRVSKTFARALIGSALEGRTLHRDAYSLLAIKKFSTFQELTTKLGVG